MQRLHGNEKYLTVDLNFDKLYPMKDACGVLFSSRCVFYNHEYYMWLIWVIKVYFYLDTNYFTEYFLLSPPNICTLPI